MPKHNIPYLRSHSYYGFFDSLLSPETLVNLAVQNEIQTLGLTDYQYLTGAIPFYELCTANAIKPIIGLEIDLTFHDYQGRLTLYAKNRDGWSNLSRLSSFILSDNNVVDINALKTHQEGLICLSGDERSVLRELMFNSPPVQQLPDSLLLNLIDIFQEDCLIEIQRYASGSLQYEKHLVALARRHHLPLIAAQNIFYKEKSDQTHYRTLTAIKHNSTIQDLSKNLLPSGNAYFPTLQDFVHRYQDLPEAIENLELIQNRCNLSLPIGQTHFPNFPTPKGEPQSQYLRLRAFEGAKSRYGKLTPEITERLNDELEIILKMGYEPIFLIVEDVLNHARSMGIPTSSRGSAASSLVAHCLNITSPDPLALNLYFERFLNPARKKPPDIDTDIASHRRDEVIQYVFDTYGVDRVAMVGTINRYRPKSAIGDTAKAYGLSPEAIRQLSKRLPSSYRFQRENEPADPFSPLMHENTIPIIKDIVSDARAILDIPRHLSVHPGGIIIAPFPITDLIPLVYSKSLGINHAQFDLKGIEKLGMVKIDLLGIRGLTVLGEVANRIQSWRISEFTDGLSVLDSIPNDDQQTATTVSEAKTIGCFQIESPGMRATLKEINAKKVEDIMAALALYRPGPLRGGLRDAFVRRFRGEEPVTHIHASLSKLLDNTLGVILYQEQVLRIAHELGGLTIAQADILRRAMSHFDPGNVMDTLRINFVDGAALRHKVPAETAERIWDMMAAFAGYGFPKAHAASYAQLAWNSAWCKTHYPAEFMAAVLGFGGGYYSQRVYLMEARRLNLPINPPHINHANARFRVKYPKGNPTLYMGLNQVRDLTHRTIQSILNNRPFNSLEDFLLRADPQKKETEHLIMCNALDGLTTIPEGLKRLKHQHPPGQLQLFLQPKQSSEWSLKQKITAQQEILGVSLELTPFEQYADQIQSAGTVSTLEAQSLIGEKIRVAGMRQTLRSYRTQSNQTMGILNLEDLEGSLQIMISPALYQKHNLSLKESGPFLIEGVIEKDTVHTRIQMRAENIKSLF